MTIKKVIQLLKKDNKLHLRGIELYNSILKKYEELDKTDPPSFELSKRMQQLFLDLIIMMKFLEESQMRFNKRVIRMLTKDTVHHHQQ